MIFWGIIMILVLSVVPFLFINNWFNIIETYNKNIWLKIGLYLITSIIVYVIISVKFGYKNIDDLVSVADSFFEYIKNSFIFRYVCDGGFLANIKNPFSDGASVITVIIAIIAVIVHFSLMCESFIYLEDNIKRKNGTFSMVFNFSLSVIFAITTVLMFIFKEKGGIISLILLILFIVPLVIRIIKTQHECKITILKNSIMLSIVLVGFIFCWKVAVYSLVLLIVGFFMYSGGGGVITDPQPTKLERQRKKISAIQGELYDGEWTYKDGYITSSDGFTKRKVVDSDIHGKVITDEYGERHVQTHSSEIDY